MRDTLQILMIASEAVPYVKEGGLGDVAGTLPKALAAAGHDVRLVIPRYFAIDRERFGLRPLPGTLVVPMGIIGTMYCGVWEGRLPGSEVPVYFLEHEQFYGRSGIYGQDGEGYLDNDNRFVFLSRGGLELCKMLDFQPDLVHVHDWHTGVVPVFLNTLYRDDPWVGEAASLLTIHNMQHQGDFYPGLMEVLGVGWEHFTFLGLEKDDQVNLLKGGIYHATLLNTVSEGYLREILTPLFGWGLENVLKERAGDLYGILNGVDYEEWNPETDQLIPARFGAADLAGKAVCKADLQREFGLPVRPEVPLFGLVSRLVKQKGIDVLAAAIPRILGLDLQVVLLGSGEPWSHFYFGDIRNDYPDRFGCVIGYNNTLSHKIEAGSDFFLMPSAFEPCGMNQMFSLRYGTIPVVRATGGLDDSVENFDEATLGGTGFKFLDLSPGALFDTIGWAVHTWYHNQPAIAQLRQRGMAQRFGWEGVSRNYEELYWRAVERRLGSERFRARFAPPDPVPLLSSARELVR